MGGIPVIYKGDDATIMITGMTHSILAISDFSMTMDKGVAEQELLGAVGNYFVAGAVSCDISLTACKLHSTAIGKLVKNLLSGIETQVSGSCGPLGLHFLLDKCYVTGFDFTLGAGGRNPRARRGSPPAAPPPGLDWGASRTRIRPL